MNRRTDTRSYDLSQSVKQCDCSFCELTLRFCKAWWQSSTATAASHLRTFDHAASYSRPPVTCKFSNDRYMKLFIWPRARSKVTECLNNVGLLKLANERLYESSSSSSSSAFLDRSQNATTTTSCHAGQRYIHTSNQCCIAGQVHLGLARANKLPNTNGIK